MKRQQSPSRGGRASQRGFRLVWTGLAMLPVMLVAGILHASSAVDFALLGLMMVLALTGLGIVVYGSQIDKRELADYYRRKAAGGEEPAPAPGKPRP